MLLSLSLPSGCPLVRDNNLNRTSTSARYFVVTLLRNNRCYPAVHYFQACNSAKNIKCFISVK